MTVLRSRGRGRGAGVPLDSRTNAGVDQISTFRKMTFFEQPGERVVVIMGAGNLSITQSVIGALQERLTTASSVLQQQTMADVAHMVGEAVRDVFRRDADCAEPPWTTSPSTSNSSWAGRSAASRRGCSWSTPPATSSRAPVETRYFQLGEAKYGKPIIDRVVRRGHRAGRGGQVPAGVDGLHAAFQPDGGHAAGPRHPAAWRGARDAAPEHRQRR